MSIKIGIISDLHCQHGTETYKSTYLYSDSLRKPVNFHPVESLKTFIDKNKPQLDCDYLICLGDITNKIDKQGLMSGWSFINEIHSAIGSKMIICSAGNHDVDFKGFHKESSKFNTITRDSILFPLNNPDCEQNYWDKQYCIYEDDQLILIAINTVYNFENETKSKNPIVNDATLDNIKSDLSIHKNSTKPKIAICHHHPYKFSNYQELYKDGDVLDNGDKLINLMNELNFRLIIHGHKHIPRVHTEDSTTIFCAGSFSSLRNTAEYKIPNTFHIVELTMNSNLKGKLYTYQFKQGSGWDRSTDPKAEFPAITGFGYIGDIENIAKKCDDLLKTFPSERAPYYELIKSVDEILHLTPNQQIELIQLLKTNYKIEFSPDLRVGPDSIQKQI